jgi:hypothetical protein
VTEAVAQGLRVSRRDRLVPWHRAASVLGRHPKTLDNWLRKGQVRIPVVRQPGGRATYQSWLDSVLASAQPGAEVSMAEATEQWWSDRLPSLGEVA